MLRLQRNCPLDLTEDRGVPPDAGSPSTRSPTGALVTAASPLSLAEAWSKVMSQPRRAKRCCRVRRKESRREEQGRRVSWGGGVLQAGDAAGAERREALMRES